MKRIVLTRPAVEAGEKLGFLPGDIAEKVNPYLRPLYDALYDMVDYEKATAFIERGTVEVAPLAFMRGRTLNDSFVILDEAQNTTEEQMKMFLTRLGYGSKAVVTGDVTQVDLPSGRGSGLVEVQKVLRGVEGVSFCFFSEVDVVRHPLVQEVVRAYDLFEADRRARAEARRGRSAEPDRGERVGPGAGDRLIPSGRAGAGAPAAVRFSPAPVPRCLRATRVPGSRAVSKTRRPTFAYPLGPARPHRPAATGPGASCASCSSRRSPPAAAWLLAPAGASRLPGADALGTPARARW